MPFGDGVANKERRKTSHVNEKYRKYSTDSLSDTLGIPVDERIAGTITKIVFRDIMRYLMTLEEEDFDQYGERAIALPGIGKFKIMNTKPQGRRIGLVGDPANIDSKGNYLGTETYPRFKFYPSAAMEAEVEILSGIESEDSRNIYERTLKSEKYNVEQNIKEISKIIRKLLSEYGVSIEGKVQIKSDLSLDNLGPMIKGMINNEVKRILTGKGVDVPGDAEIFEETDSFDSEDEKEELISGGGEEDTQSTDAVPEVKEKKTRKKRTKKEPEEVVDPVVSEPLSVEKKLGEEEHEFELDDILGENAKDTATTINEAIDGFDFDFDT
jgi:hypothetical protein